MGSAIIQNGQAKEIIQAKEALDIKEERRSKRKEKQVEIDVIEVSNIALAIKNKEHTINVQLTTSCRNLPRASTFKEVNSQIQVYKLTEGREQFIGKTEIVRNEVNPKYVKAFIFSHNSGKNEEVLFKIYSVDNPEIEGLEKFELIGKVSQKLDSLVEQEPFEVQVPHGQKKEKIWLKSSCTEYDGGNMKFEISLQASGFVGKLDLFYAIQVWKDPEWVPIQRSKSIEIKKTSLFQQLTVPYIRFFGEEHARVRIRVFGVREGVEEEVGVTEETTISNILLMDEKNQTQRVYKSGFVVGNITILKWRKVSKDSFISYIVNGARLHLILGIDYTNSNSEGEVSLHKVQNNTNPYIQAIREVVGLLQYFDNGNNSIALYGFGAKLPPYYKSVGQCFALNGNFFNPTVVGGVDQIIRHYLQNLQKTQPHGPTKFSEIIDIAIQFARPECESTNYYVLVLLTDGQFNDYDDTVEKIVEASGQPLSIIIVGLGNKDFSALEKLDEENEHLVSKTEKKCERDMLDFIDFKEFLQEENSANREIQLAQLTFAQIPRQFIDYMTRKNIKPSKEKKGLKAAKAEFISQKIKGYKRPDGDISIPSMPIIVVPKFLEMRKLKMRKDLISLGFDMEDDLLQNLTIPIDDLNYFIEIHSYEKKKVRAPEISQYVQYIDIQEEKKFEEYLQQQQKLSNQRIQESIEKRERNETGNRKKQVQKQPEVAKKETVLLRHPCLCCFQHQINILHEECGHLAVCSKCCTGMCFICKHFNSYLINIDNYVQQNDIH